MYRFFATIHYSLDSYPSKERRFNYHIRDRQNISQFAMKHFLWNCKMLVAYWSRTIDVVSFVYSHILMSFISWPFWTNNKNLPVIYKKRLHRSMNEKLNLMRTIYLFTHHKQSLSFFRFFTNPLSAGILILEIKLIHDKCLKASIKSINF